jgi:hypothetical protein
VGGWQGNRLIRWLLTAVLLSAAAVVVVALFTVEVAR